MCESFSSSQVTYHINGKIIYAWAAAETLSVYVPGGSAGCGAHHDHPASWLADHDLCSMFSIRSQVPTCMQISTINETKKRELVNAKDKHSTTDMTTSIPYSFGAILSCHMITSMSLLLWRPALHSQCHSARLVTTLIKPPPPPPPSFSLYSSRSIKDHNSKDEVGMPPVIWKKACKHQMLKL